MRAATRVNAEQASKREDAEADPIATSGKAATDREASETSTGRFVKRPPGVTGFVVIARRWVVGRTFAWLGRCSRLAKDWENNRIGGCLDAHRRHPKIRTSYCKKNRSGVLSQAVRRRLLEKLDQRDHQAALGDQRTEHPFEKISLHRLYFRLKLRGFGPGFLPHRFHAGLDTGNIGFGREVGVEQRDMLLGQGLGLLLGEAALRQALDEAVSIERYCLSRLDDRGRAGARQGETAFRLAEKRGPVTPSLWGTSTLSTAE